MWDMNLQKTYLELVWVKQNQIVWFCQDFANFLRKNFLITVFFLIILIDIMLKIFHR